MEISRGRRSYSAVPTETSVGRAIPRVFARCEQQMRTRNEPRRDEDGIGVCVGGLTRARHQTSACLNGARISAKSLARLFLRLRAAARQLTSFGGALDVQRAAQVSARCRWIGGARWHVNGARVSG